MAWDVVFRKEGSEKEGVGDKGTEREEQTRILKEREQVGIRHSKTS